MDTEFTAGEKAHALGISFGDNPHKTLPGKQQWEQGWKAGKRRFERILRLLFPAVDLLRKGEA